MKSETPKLLNLDTSPKTLAVSLCDEVEPSLFLGSFDAVTKPELLNSLGISHILTVGPGMEIKDFPSHIKRKQILVLDEDNQNLLQYFDETNNFILEGLATNGKVLVHCMAGISRSATVVCAFLMKHRSLSSQEALSTLTTVRSIIDPNPGFREQLEIYEQIAFEVNVKHEPYRRFLISKMAEDFLSLGHSNDMILGVDPEQMMTGGVPTPSSFLKIRCKRCRRALIYPENIIEHEPGKGQTAFQHRKRDSNFAKGHNETCSSYFIEPMAWIEGLQGGALEGKIDCPKCNTKLGSYTWRGSQCSCGTWVTPAFMVHRSKVDAMAARSVSYYQ
ncbi:tyrosine protein phosphatase yvh1 [Entomophthora muscae]|uniref:Tyrosine protein phosphatase yvh1 n=2 Tax=Entomophthora muscae TaxID=34485 RepID=A0ACC2TEG8_9FUNG|nr:tyrosine protein phosphatase yvh1 [Entomophthora muscae]